jgi:hypothetical protein
VGSHELMCSCQEMWDGERDCIECHYCKVWYHGSCEGLNEQQFKRLKSKKATKYRCLRCSHTTSLAPTTTTTTTTTTSTTTTTPVKLLIERTLGVVTRESVRHIPLDRTNTAYSASCGECTRERPVPTRYTRQSGVEVMVTVSLSGDMKCLDCIIGKQGCSALHFCPKCNISKRSMAPGLPQCSPHALLTPNEQSIEGLHVRYNKQAQRHRNQRDKRRKLQRMVRGCQATTHASLQSHAGTAKRRKFSNPVRALRRDINAQMR